MSTFKIVYGVSTSASASASRNRLCLYLCVKARYQFCERSPIVFVSVVVWRLAINSMRDVAIVFVSVVVWRLAIYSVKHRNRHYICSSVDARFVTVVMSRSIL